jgi:hypothetical protein
MFEKTMYYMNWILFIVSFVAMIVVSFPIVQGLSTDIVCLGRQCASQATHPDWYWINLSMYSVGILVLVLFARRQWKEIRAYNQP